MSAFEDVCWHEAGHGVIAGVQGLATMRILVRQNQAGTDWCGYRHGTGGHPLSRMRVAAAGMAGQLLRKGIPTTQAAAPADLQDARQRASDDLQKYLGIARQVRGAVSPFEDEMASTFCWGVLAGDYALKHRALAEELIQHRKVGPLVYAEIMMGTPITQPSRDADDLFLVALEQVIPAPAPAP